MKMTTAITSTLATAGLFAMAYAQNVQNDPVRYSVVHYGPGTVLVMDTTVQDADAYPVEQFLADHGLDAGDAEIIYLDELDGTYMNKFDKEVWMMPSSGVGSGRTMFCITDDKKSMGKRSSTEVRVKNIMDENGNIVTEKWIDGEKVEGGEGDHIWIEKSEGEGDPQRVRVHKMNKGTNKGIGISEAMKLLDVQVEKEIDSDGNEVVHVFINGEEVDPSALDTLGVPPPGAQVFIEIEGEEMGDGEEMEIEFGDGSMEVQVQKMIDDEGNETIQVWLNGEEVDPSVLDSLNAAAGENTIIIQKEFIMEFEGDDNGEQIIIMEGGGNHFRTMPTGSGHTVVLVSSAGGEKKAEEPLQTSKLSIEELRFSPNPNNGQFELSFFLPNNTKTEVVVYATDGRTVYQENLGKFSGPYRKNIDISKEGAGTYILHIKQGKKTLAEKLIIQ
jgi:hypothetical protein